MSSPSSIRSNFTVGTRIRVLLSRITGRFPCLAIVYAKPRDTPRYSAAVSMLTVGGPWRRLSSVRLLCVVSANLLMCLAWLK